MIAHRLRLALTFGSLLVLGCGGESEPLPEPDFEPEAGFTAIGLDDLVVFEPKADAGTVNWSERGGRLECAGLARGYVHTKQPYDDFTLRYELRYPTAAEVSDATKLNTGALLFITGEHRVWPRCLEVQGRYDELAQVKSNARDVTVAVAFDESARESARKPAGEWNAVEVVAESGAVTVTLNGTPVAVSEPTELVSGPIGLQSEGNPVWFRRIRIRADDGAR